jgi:hypothetical protein
MTDIQQELPPPCPECDAVTALKEVHRHHLDESYIFFFKCPACAVEYPRTVDPAQLEFARSSNIRIPGDIKNRA